MDSNKIEFLHIDVNNAFLSWEAAYRMQMGAQLDLRDIPSVVGGNQVTRHGIVLAKSIPAKKLYGIKTGEPLFSVRKRAPDIISVPPRYDLYIKCIDAMVRLLAAYSPSVQRFSVDEVFLDYTGCQRYHGPIEETAQTISQHIKEELGFTVNIGISTNKLLAKMASEFEKPDKVHTLFPAEIHEKMWPLPVDELYMVGRKTANKLKDRNVFTIGDLANTDPELLFNWFKSWGYLYWNFANGRYIDSGKKGAANFQSVSHSHSDDLGAKGMGNSSTIHFDVTDTVTAHKVLLALCETVCTRLRSADRLARTAHVSYTTWDFKRFGKEHRYPWFTNSTKELYDRICTLFDELWDKNTPIRQMGVWTGGLVSNECKQLDFIDLGIE